MQLTNRTVLITGGTSGIGQEFARQLVLRSNTVIVTGRSQEKLDATLSGLAGVHGIKSDVGNPADVRALYEQVIERFPSIDVVINNAGLMFPVDLTKPVSDRDVVEEITVNLSGPIRVMAQFAAHLSKQPSAAIINVTSGLAYVPMPLAPIYSASKAGLNSFTKSMQVQFSGSNLSVIEVVPPMVDTPMNRSSGTTRKMMDPATFVRKALEGIESGQSNVVIGESRMLRIMSRIAPNMMLAQMAKV
jgi:uncharacterized oxidoreductase